MIKINPYRRVRLECPLDGATRSAHGIALSLACHKGDSNPQANQTSDQQGAQTQGVVASGSSNKTNTGTQIGNLVTGGTNAPTSVSGNGNVITDNGAVKQALDLVGNVLQGVDNVVTNSQNAIQGNLNGMSNFGSVSTAGGGPTPVVVNSSASSTTIVLALAAVAAVAFAFRKKP